MAGKKLLVADDSLTIQKVIRLALSNEGYEIQAVSDGNDAIQQVSLFRPDVVLIDVSLPGKSAFEVKRSINEMDDLQEVRFVLMSSAFEKVDEPQAAEVVFHGRLTKPFDPAHLRQILQDVLAQVTAQRMEKTSILQRPTPPPTSASGDAPMMAPPPPASAQEHLNPPSIEMDLPLTPAPPQGMAPPVDEFPTLNESAAEPVEALWDPGTPTDTDIKSLTESTIRISGLDDFNWSVQEPTMKPPSGFADTGSSNFKFSEQDAAAPLPPPPSMEDSFDTPTAPAIPAPSTLGSGDMEALVRREVQATLEKMARQMLPDVAERVIKQEIHRLLTEQI